MTPMITRACLPAVLAAAVVLSLTACGDDEPVADSIPTTDPTSEPTPTEDSTAAAVAEVEAAYQEYWDVVVAAHNSGEDSYAELKTVTNEEVAQLHVAQIRGMREDHITRDGAPDIGTPQVSVDGDTARVQSCVDEHSWNVYYKEELAEQESDPQPRVFDFERVDDHWVVVDRVNKDEATIEC